MSIALKLPNPQQHARLFLDDVITRYKAKAMSAAEYILNLVNIYRAKGQKLNLPSAKAFYESFGIAKSTFYRALNKLESIPELGFHWEPTGGIALWCGEIEESTPAPPAAEKTPTYTNLRDIPKALQKEFETFVRKEWRKFKGQEIVAFHIFMSKAGAVQSWWEKFQQHKIAAAAVVAAEPEIQRELEPAGKRTFSPIPDRLKGLFGKKPT